MLQSIITNFYCKYSAKKYLMMLLFYFGIFVQSAMRKTEPIGC